MLPQSPFLVPCMKCVEYDPGVLKIDGQVEIESVDSSPFSQAAIAAR